MIHCFQLCFNFAFNCNLRRYTRAFSAATAASAAADTAAIAACRREVLAAFNLLGSSAGAGGVSYNAVNAQLDGRGLHSSTSQLNLSRF
jgi:hypothetical protein